MLLPLATAPKEIAWGCLVAISLIRALRIRDCYAGLFKNHTLWLLFAWTAWHSISILWSLDQQTGLNELKTFRVVVIPILLWPVLGQVRLFIGAFLIGVVFANFIQLTQYFQWFGNKPVFAGRLNGWIHAIHTATVCGAAICWHLSALIKGRGWLRWLSVIGAIIAAAGLIMTGSRGPWIATAIALLIGFVWFCAKGYLPMKTVIVIVVVGVIGGGAAWFAKGDFIETRIEQTITQLQQAMDGDFDSDVGTRLARWSGAWKIFTKSPLQGSGAGGFGKAIGELGLGDLSLEEHHAHSVYMQVLATTGVIGAIIIATLFVLALAARGSPKLDNVFSYGTKLVLVIWLIGAVFDAYHLNGNMFGLFTFVLALSFSEGEKE